MKKSNYKTKCEQEIRNYIKFEEEKGNDPVFTLWDMLYDNLDKSALIEKCPERYDSRDEYEIDVEREIIEDLLYEYSRNSF